MADSRSCSKPAISRRASACSRTASRAARSSNERPIGIVPLDGMKWAKVQNRVPTKVSQVLNPGDVVYVEPTKTHRPIPPASSSGSIRRDRRDGSVDRPRARDGRRLLLRSEPVQPRDAGASPARLVVQAVRLCHRARQRLHALDVVLDAPIEIDQGPGQAAWEPENYEGKFYGPSTLRFGIEHSRNVMTVRLAQDVGMPLIAEYAKRLRRLRRSAAVSFLRARRRRDHFAAHGQPPIRCSTMADGA